MPDAPFPRYSTVEYPALDELKTPPVRFAVNYWRDLRGTRPFPARADLQFRALASMLRYMSLVRVLDGGADFEHRFVGDAQVSAFSVKLQNRCFSDIEKEAPQLIAISRPSFQRVVESRSPLGLKGHTGRDAAAVVFTEVEEVFLPFGDSDEAVDHIAVFSSYSSRLAPPADYSARLRENSTA
jgi:hypothetical protein